MAAISAISPSNFGLAVGVNSSVKVTFGSAMNKNTITNNTIQLLDAGNHVIAGRIAYNLNNKTAIFDANVPLQYGQTYHTLIKGGAAGVLDSGGGTLSGDASWSFTTSAAPTTGTGGPILIVTSTSNPFSSYYPEILRAEGMNSFATADVSAVNSTLLNNYNVVILSEMALSAAVVTALTNWVNSGGNLIAMKPDKQLSSLLGLTSTVNTTSNTYIKINTTTGPGIGITSDTMQYHGAADLYNLNGATSIAALFSNASAGTSNPAVTVRSVGSNGGQAAAFTYDLAKSIIYTRQGNPAWSGQERDGTAPIRSDDLFFGNSTSDPQPDWVDLNKVQIPQADEQQRLLANMIESMNLDRMPLPRFWYLPNGNKAEVVMTGDDHNLSGNGSGTSGRWSQYLSAGTSGGQPILGTSYIVKGGSLTDAQVAQLVALGFEAGLHVEVEDASGTPRNWTSFADLSSLYQTELNEFESRYPSLGAPKTNRTHAIVWSDYDSQPQIEYANNIRLDTNYYYWPGAWVQDRPGMFTGSGMPMRFAKANGTLIDVYQAATQMTDESGITNSYHIDTLLNNALGSLGYYGAFTVNAHTDYAASALSDAVIASAKTHNVPVVTAQQMMNWLDGRNGSKFSAMTWNNTAKSLTFSVTTAEGSNGLQAMVPVRGNGALRLSGITSGGNAVPFTTQNIKGIQYAFFNASTASYVAQYANDTTAPTVASKAPSNAASNVPVTAKITATFSEDVQPGTISYFVRDAASVTVVGTTSYDATSNTAIFTPNVPLNPGATYTATISGVKDNAGNAIAAPVAWSFSTATNAVQTIWSPSDTPAVMNTADGAVEVGVKFRSDVPGQIKGIRFFKGALNTGTHIGSLWTSTGTLLSQVTFTSESSGGWQDVTLANPITIAANTTYVASYHTNVGNYSANSNYFATGKDNAYLHALASGVDGGNGVFAYGANPSFPTQSFNSNNYWVDVDFLPQISDTTPPTIASQNPAPNAINVAIGAGISAIFSEGIQASTVTMTLKNAGNINVTGSFAYDPLTLTATFTPSAPLAPSTNYIATISGAMDAAGNAMTPVSWSFSTAQITGATIWAGTVTPSVTAASDSNAVELGVKFSASANGTITGLRFYKGTGNTGTHVGHLWTSTGTLLGTVTFASESSTGWQQATFATPVQITAGTTYIASYFAPRGHYAGDVNYFAAGGVTRGPLTALPNSAPGGNGVYHYGTTGGFPSDTFSASNFWVDVVYSSSSGTDTAAPTVTSITPASGATGIGLNSAVTATFSEPVQAATISMVLKDSGNNSVAGATSYDAATNIAKFTPAGALTTGMIYTMTLSGAKDSAGNTMAVTNWSFTTTSSSSVSIWSDTTIPAAITSSDATAVELGVKFRSNAAGYITALRFYKGTGNGGTHVGHLWSSTGTLLATVTYTSETASGWQTATLSTPIAITANTTYIASYFAPQGHYAFDTAYFAASGVSNGAITALANGVDGGNGVYAYGATGGFPNQSFNSTNYWADVVYSSTTPSDSTAPTIVSRSPASGTTGVATSSPIIAKFSEPIQSGSISMVLKNAANVTVPGSFAYSGATNTATFTPASPLALNTVYTIAVTGAKDASGNVMQNAGWSFTTAASSIYSVWNDSTVPSVAASDDTSPVEVGMKFRVSSNGFVTGVRFYKGAGNGGTHIGHLWDSAGNLLATVTFAGESAVGWQTATFSTPISVTAGQTYVVSYYAPQGSYSDTQSYFATSGTTTGAITALAAGVDGGNGVYRYGVGGGFPNATFNSTNYWVDVLFTTTLP